MKRAKGKADAWSHYSKTLKASNCRAGDIRTPTLCSQRIDLYHCMDLDGLIRISIFSTLIAEPSSPIQAHLDPYPLQFPLQSKAGQLVEPTTPGLEDGLCRWVVICSRLLLYPIGPAFIGFRARRRRVFITLNYPQVPDRVGTKVGTVSVRFLQVLLSKPRAQPSNRARYSLRARGIRTVTSGLPVTREYQRCSRCQP
jgi:hypothetical protein